MTPDRQDDELLEARRHALSDSLRLRIREAVSVQPKTVKQIGAQLGVIPNRLYYHLRILEAAELIAVVGTSATGRMTEKLYGAAGGSFGSELPGDEPSEQAVFFASILEATKIELADNVLAKTMPDSEHPTHASLFRGVLVCTDAQRESFWAELTGLIDRYNDETLERIADEDDALPPDVHANAITIAVYEQQLDADAIEEADG